MSRRLILVVLAIIAIFAAATIYDLTKPVTFYGSTIDPPKQMGDFTLQSKQGPVKLSEFRGKYVILYFGYTSCPDICPTTLAGLSAVINNLTKAETSQLQVIFVSVDYKRDTPEKMANYTGAFNPAFIGLSGTQSQIDQVTRQYDIYYKLNDPDPKTGFYSVDHTSTVLVLDPHGELIMTWPYGQQPDEIASDIKNLLKK
jgi:protein SCO1